MILETNYSLRPISRVSFHFVSCKIIKDFEFHLSLNFSNIFRCIICYGRRLNSLLDGIIVLEEPGVRGVRGASVRVPVARGFNPNLANAFLISK